MSTTAIADTLVQDLVTTLSTVTDVPDGLVHVYDTAEILFKGRTLCLPSFTVIYTRTTRTEGNCSQRLGYYNFDIYVQAGKTAENRLDGCVLKLATCLLQCIKNLLLVDCRKSTFGREWEFMGVNPVAIKEDTITYVSRWRTRAPLISA